MVQLDTKAGCVMGWVLCCTDDHKSILYSGQIHDVKITKNYKLPNYMFESTLTANRLWLNMFNLRGGFCAMVKY